MMLSIFTDNTMISGSIQDRLDMTFVTTSVIRGSERLAERILRAAVAPVVADYVYVVCSPAKGCQSFMKPVKHWLPGISGLNPRICLLANGQPVGSGIANLTSLHAG